MWVPTQTVLSCAPSVRSGVANSPWAKALCLFSVNEVLLEHNHIHLLHIACGFQGTTAELSSHVLLNIGDTLWRNVAFDYLSSCRRTCSFTNRDGAAHHTPRLGSAVLLPGCTPVQHVGDCRQL